MGQMIERIGDAAMLEQFAEECAEAAKEALKCARIIRGENPTPVSLDEARMALNEEYTDIRTCANELCLKYIPEIEHKKQERFMKRWSALQTE